MSEFSTLLDTVYIGKLIADCEKVAIEKSESEGGIWVIWEDWNASRMRVTPIEIWEAERTGADHAYRFYEDGEESR